MTVLNHVPSSSSIVIVVVLAVGLGPSPDGGLTGMLREPRNSSLSSNTVSANTETSTRMLASSGFSVKSILFPL